MPISALTIVNALSVKAGGSRRLVRGMAYGPNVRQRLDIYAPREQGGVRGVIVFIYGGSWSDGERSNYVFAGRYLAALGYVVVVPDYRLLPAASYPAFIEDCADAVRWTLGHIGEFGGDPERLVLMGHSAGAYNAAMVVLDRRYGLDGSARALVGLSGPYDFYPFDVEITRRTFGAVPDPASTQPVNHAGPHAPPMFLATGDADRLVYPRNTAALAERLRRHGVPVEERHYVGLGHPSLLLRLGSILNGGGPFVDDLTDYLALHLDG